MPASSLVMPYAAESLLRGRFGDLALAGELRCLLLTSTFVLAQTEVYVSDLTNEVTDASYARVTCPNVTVAYDDQTGFTKLDCDDFAFPNLTAPDIQYVVFYSEQTTDADSPLLIVWDLGAPEASAAAPYAITIDAAGLLYTEVV